MAPGRGGGKALHQVGPGEEHVLHGLGDVFRQDQVVPGVVKGGFRLAALRRRTLSRPEAEAFYAVHA